jgi:radical SAM/Cys-rich protein
MLSTREHLFPTDFPPLTRAPLQTLQVNLGYRCNQQCLHCHVNAGPKRTETMSDDTARQVIDFLRRSGVGVLDITGGAPEMNACFRGLVIQARELGVHVIDRCNLTILQEPGYEDLAEFLADNDVEIVASLPCYLEENVDKQRGKGVFQSSIIGLQRLYALGYGNENSARVLNLVFNPQGPVLPPPQAALETDYRRMLGERYGIQFNHLFTITNMPILRFGSTLLSNGEFEPYLELLKQSHLDENLARVMCRSLISIDYLGYVFDCDFNQMLDMPVVDPDQHRLHISSLSTDQLSETPIQVGEHCYGCTAGQGSSCGGAFDG